MRYLAGFAALGSLALGVVAQNEALNYTVNSVQEANYLAATCTTALCTVFITEIRETIKFSTVTEYAGTTTDYEGTTTTTCTEFTTAWTTTTTTETFSTSYPYTTTTIVHCPEQTEEPTEPEPTDPYPTDPYPTDDPYPTHVFPTYKRRTPEHETPICYTETVTEWKTTTTTTVSTKWVPTVIPTVIPTTIPTTITATRSTTIWQPTTYTTEVTVTSGTTVISTTVSTVTTSVPVVSYETEIVTQTVTTQQTITLPGDVTTLPAETITLPGDVTTLPGTTIISTIIVEGPEITTTITEDGVTITTTVPGPTSITTATSIIPPTTVTAPGTTITATALVDITLCPTPTGNSSPLDIDSDRTFGCASGYVCNPPKPDDCNFWVDSPSSDFLCAPEDCILAPPLRNITWADDETSYYPPSYGYFYLNPEAFGLSFDIFEYRIEEHVKDGEVVTITTGNWESQASLSDWPRPSASVAEAEVDPYTDRLRKRLMKRAITPPVCYDNCNGAYVIALRIGKSDALCDEDGDFQLAYAGCLECINSNGNSTRLPTRDYVEPRFEQFIDFCGDTAPVDPEPSATGPDSIEPTDPIVTTNTQDGISEEPTATTTTTTSESDSPSTTSTPTSASESETSTETPTETSTETETGSGTPTETPTSTSLSPSASSPSVTSSDVSPTVSIVPVPTPTTTPPVVLPPSAASRIGAAGLYYAVVATFASLLLGALLI